MTWPPTLADMKADMGYTDTSEDVRLAIVLAAAIDYVEQAKAGDCDFTVPYVALDNPIPEPTARINLGTIRLAWREHERRKSVDGLVDMGELGSARIPGTDPDIDRLLGLGKWCGMRFA